MRLGQSEPSTAVFTSCDHLLGGYLCLPPLHRFISSPLYSLTLLPHLFCHSSSLLPSSAPFFLWVYPLKWFVKLSCVLPQELTSYTEGVSRGFYKVRSLWELVSVQFVQTVKLQFIVKRAEKSLNVNIFQIITRNTKGIIQGILTSILWRKWRLGRCKVFSRNASFFNAVWLFFSPPLLQIAVNLWVKMAVFQNNFWVSILIMSGN